MFEGRDLEDSICLSDDVTDAFKLLESQNQQLSEPGPSRETYVLAIRTVKECFKAITRKTYDRGMLFSWPITVSQDYLELLGSRQPMALVILAYYAVILYEVRDKWWTMGWGSQLVQEINQMLDGNWNSLMAWPMGKIRVGG